MPAKALSPEALAARASSLTLDAETWARLSQWMLLLHKMSANSNLVGTRDPERMIDELLLDSLAALPLLPRSGWVVDVGAGAGIPALPLQLARPDLRFTLIEPRQRRVAFLRLSRRELNIDSLDVFRGRLDEWTSSQSGEDTPQLMMSKAVFSPHDWLEETKTLPAGAEVLIFGRGDSDTLWSSLQPQPRWELSDSVQHELRPDEPRSVLKLRRR